MISEISGFLSALNNKRINFFDILNLVLQFYNLFFIFKVFLTNQSNCALLLSK